MSMTEPEPETETCLNCDTFEAEYYCAACDAPLCDECAVMRDFDRYCPGGKCLL